MKKRDNLMRVLTQAEINAVSGAFPTLVEGIVTDDFAVAGAAIGLFVGAYGLGVYARSRYNQEIISFKTAAQCTFWTAVEAAKYGIAIDGLCLVFNKLYQAIS